MSTTPNTLRSVTLTRTSTGSYRATNPGGASVELGAREDLLSPVEMLLAAIGACSATDVDTVTARRAEPTTFQVTVSGHKDRDDDGAHLRDLRMEVVIAFPDTPEGEQAQGMVPRLVKLSHDTTCTVSRTVERGTPVAVTLDGQPVG